MALWLSREHAQWELLDDPRGLQWPESDTAHTKSLALFNTDAAAVVGDIFLSCNTAFFTLVSGCLTHKTWSTYHCVCMKSQILSKHSPGWGLLVLQENVDREFSPFCRLLTWSGFPSQCCCCFLNLTAMYGCVEAFPRRVWWAKFHFLVFTVPSWPFLS